jgi:hypothetical protein
MTSHPVSPLGPVKLAITMDDMLLFRGVPVPKNYSCLGIARALAVYRRNSCSHVAEEHVFRSPLRIAMAAAALAQATLTVLLLRTARSTLTLESNSITA